MNEIGVKVSVSALKFADTESDNSNCLLEECCVICSMVYRLLQHWSCKAEGMSERSGSKGI